MATDVIQLSSATPEVVRQHLRERAQKTYRRRQATSFVMVGLCWLAIGVAMIPLGDIVLELIRRGGSTLLHWSFYTQLPQSPTIASPDAVGGVSNYLVGSLAILAYSLLFAIPLGVAMGVYLAESDSKFATVLRLVTATMVGAPSILMGLFAFGLIVIQLNLGFSIFAGSFALGVMMLPVLASSTEIAVRNVPATLREASLALGAKPSTASLRVVLPAAMTGIVTGAILAVSRAIGETAPVLLVIGGANAITWKPTDLGSSLPVAIYQDVNSAYPSQQHQAWGIALFLVLVILILSVTARLWAARKQKERR
jgi:phosphate transport system permease protein